MKVVIVNCFETYEIRVKNVLDFFKQNGNQVTVIQSDFMHIKKERITDRKKDYVYIHAKQYKKNFSFSRLYSHWKFSKDSLNVIKEFKPDLLYVLIPPNSLTKYIAKYKKNNNNVKLIFDVIDLWPETMPISRIKNLFPFIFWKRLREEYINYADFVITECNLYHEYLNVDEKKIQTIYFAKEKPKVESKINLSNDKIVLCYLGSINNIIDIDCICSLIKKISSIKSVVLKIIGDGERKKDLINNVITLGAEVIDYGKIYDEKKKQEIFDTCHYGLNIYKDSTVIGLTMKSIDYFVAGLPIINNIGSDTYEIIKNYGCGINIQDENVIEKIILYNLDSRIKMQQMYDDLFSKSNYKDAIISILQKIV